MSNEVLFLEYPKCSTCKKAKKWLDEHGVSYTARHIVEDNPSADELRAWHERGGLPLKRFFNTSGMLYREMELSKRLPDMNEASQYALLASDGMLVKRPPAGDRRDGDSWFQGRCLDASIGSIAPACRFVVQTVGAT